jgi:surfeit locus 1 family protein
MTPRQSRNGLARLPVVATIIVLIAVGIMIRLGLWQLDRLHQKEALLAEYAQSQANTQVIDWPADAARAEDLLYRHARLSCESVSHRSVVAGRNAEGQVGLAETVTCRLAGGGTARVVLGWSQEPKIADWPGGDVEGVIAPGPRLVADPPVAGLEPNANPDPSEIPNNHFSYAIQWFLFAAIALVIYALALRKRLAGGGADG